VKRTSAPPEFASALSALYHVQQRLEFPPASCYTGGIRIAIDGSIRM